MDAVRVSHRNHSPDGSLCRNSNAKRKCDWRAQQVPMVIKTSITSCNLYRIESFRSIRFCDIAWNLSNACNKALQHRAPNWCFHQMGRPTDTVGISAILVKSTLGGKLIDSEAGYLLMMVIESIKNDYTIPIKWKAHNGANLSETMLIS